MSQPDRLVDGVDVGDEQVADLVAGGSVEQHKGAQKRLVRVDGRISGPVAEQSTLLVEREGRADEALGRPSGRPWVGSTRTILRALANRKNCRVTCSRRGRFLGCKAKNTSTSTTGTGSYRLPQSRGKQQQQAVG